MKHSTYLEPSGAALDHYHRYEEDIRLMSKAGLNAYRFSIEWARIEPQEGIFAPDEIEHYRKVISCCRENGLEPIVTLLHFTSPKWLISRGGWESDAAVAYFVRYVRYVMEQLGEDITYVCTINEANIGLEIASIAKRYAQAMQAAMQNPDSVQTVIREICPHAKVGLTLSLHDIQTVPGGEELAAQKWELEFRHYLPAIRDDDFLGVQNYTRSVIGPGGELPVPEGAETTQMDYEYYLQGLVHVLRRVAEDFQGDLLVTENGIATADDRRRQAFVQTALESAG